MVKREICFGKSRFDLQLSGNDTCFVEVKGVTLEKDNWSYFPDAPTQRGRKHIDEMIGVIEKGYRGVILFIVQIPYAKGFSPNWATDPGFAQKLKEASEKGVEILAYKCHISPNEVFVTEKIPVIL